MANTFVNKKADLTSTSATTLYTVPSATTAVVKSILVSVVEQSDVRFFDTKTPLFYFDRSIGRINRSKWTVN